MIPNSCFKVFETMLKINKLKKKNVDVLNWDTISFTIELTTDVANLWYQTACQDLQENLHHNINSKKSKAKTYCIDTKRSAGNVI